MKGPNPATDLAALRLPLAFLWLWVALPPRALPAIHMVRAWLVHASCWCGPVAFVELNPTPNVRQHMLKLLAAVRSRGATSGVVVHWDLQVADEAHAMRMRWLTAHRRPGWEIFAARTFLPILGHTQPSRRICCTPTA